MSDIPVVEIFRLAYDPELTRGIMLLPTGKRISSLELPWKNNEHGVSCIPAGTYDLKLTWSNRFKKKMYQVMDVPGRSGIRIHVANYPSQLEGCIAVGLAFGPRMVTSSGAAYALFESIMAGRDAKIIIHPPTS